MEKREAKKQVIQAGKELSKSGLIARTWGNVSCRVDDETFVITASGRNYLTLTEEEVVEVKMSDLSYEGDIKPSSEKRIHRAIYQLKDDAQFVIHTHQENASAISAMGVSEIELNQACEGIGERVICAEYGLPGTETLCANTVKAVSASDGKAVILKHHGAVIYGSSYEEAFRTAHNLEQACGQYLDQLHPDITRHPASKEFIQNQHEKAVIWNCSPVVKAFLKEEIRLKPYLDDFAQMAGMSMKFAGPEAIESAVRTGKSMLVRGRGALCVGKNVSDAEALSMLVEKNCKAYFAAKESGGTPIKFFDRFLMRQIYLRKYSKLGE
ncbi:class II aldolase/adducin family protein [Ihubacter massiliensis]|uniref:Class II aldolase/adducin family protein n=1 Tax=Hominibacterium faecale TaxID=2839743 RepID=A0A9J6QPP3_9FIRM|nr:MULTISPECIES: class II aldolase/adducin family protein [Eubacteriales Family XIII. Incertae Sedis]MCO7121763.1 class II aldolase/adducin family protein [Ihubacter massiliensis]MCU7377693.1 class II aldolase/adducin family protein [Hominibacterium faecale]MCU7379169.1 class II aldolase/adducin family protein [Hominibacterium faecale]